MALREIAYRDGHFSISYTLHHSDKERTILFLHGWGSNKEIMAQAFAKQFPNHRLLFIDLPGFGQSLNEEPLRTEDYAKIVASFLEDMRIEPCAVVGHSFGGKVATLLSPSALILLSSAGIVVPKPLKIRLKIRLFKLLKPFGGSALRKFFASKDANEMSEAMYQTFKNVVDEDFESVFQSYQGQALLFWGKADRATPLSSGEKIASLIQNSTLYPLEGDHFFFLEQAPFIAQTIEQELSSC